MSRPFVGHPRRTLLALSICALILLPCAGFTQYLLGASGGGMVFDMLARKHDVHSSASFEPAPAPFWTASLFYRETHFDHTNLGLELVYSRREFHATYSDAGLAGSYGTSGFVELDLLHLAIIPQVSLSRSKRVVIRFGVVNGILLRGRITGREWYQAGGTNTERRIENETAKDFGGDHRLYLGFGWEFPFSSRTSLMVDPYFNHSFTSLLKERPYVKGPEWGVRFGLALRMPGTTLSEWMGRITPADDLSY